MGPLFVLCTTLWVKRSTTQIEELNKRMTHCIPVHTCSVIVRFARTIPLKKLENLIVSIKASIVDLYYTRLHICKNDSYRKQWSKLNREYDDIRQYSRPNKANHGKSWMLVYLVYYDGCCSQFVKVWMENVQLTYLSLVYIFCKITLNSNIFVKHLHLAATNKRT